MRFQAAAWWGFHYGINGGMEGKADLLGESVICSGVCSG